MTRKTNLHTLALWAALPMARTTQVESRLHMILKPNASRRALTRRAALVSLAAAALGVGTLAALRPAAQAQSDAAPTSWKQTLPNGATVELLGVSDPLTGSSQWWQPDGAPLAAPLIIRTTTVTTTGKGQRMFAVRVAPPPGGPQWVSATYEVPGVGSLGSTDVTLTPSGQHLPGLYAVLAGADALPTSVTLRCGVAAGAWETQETQVENFAGAASGRGNVIFSRLSEIKGSTAITVTTTLASTVAQWRVLAVDTTGKVYTSGGRGRVGGNGVQQETCVFEGLPVGKVKEVRFQTRPYQWAEFKNIALHPSQH